LQDKGHNYQFEKLQNQIDLCEKHIINLNEIKNLNNNVEDIQDVQNIENNYKEDLVIKTVTENRKHRKVVLEDYEELLNSYIMVNNKHLDEKNRLIQLLFMNILSMFINEKDEICIVHEICKTKIDEELRISEYGKVSNVLICYIWNCIFQFIHKLIEIKFFDNNLEENSYRFILNPRLGIRSYSYEEIEMDYFVTNFSLELLKKIYEYTLFYRTKILYFLMNIIYTILKKKNKSENNLMFILSRKDKDSIFKLLTYNPKTGKLKTHGVNRTNFNNDHFNQLKF